MIYGPDGPQEEKRRLYYVETFRSFRLREVGMESIPSIKMSRTEIVIGCTTITREAFLELYERYKPLLCPAEQTIKVQ